MKAPEHRVDRGRLKPSIFALVGLRPPASEHTEAESLLLQRFSAGARTIVEIGVAEGASAWEMRRGMAADGDLYLVDPYHLSRLGRLSPKRLVAHRLVGSATRGRATWIEELSQTVPVGWTTPIDFLFIDGDHRYEAVVADWEAWAPHVAAGGFVALHDARVAAPWVDASSGPARLLASLKDDGGWGIVGEVDSLAILTRRGPGSSAPRSAPASRG